MPRKKPKSKSVSKKSTYSFSTILLFLVALVGTILLAKKNNAKSNLGEETEPNEPKGKSSGSSGGNKTSGNNFPLKAGAKSTVVTSIQQQLNRLFNLNLATDGTLGPITIKALANNGYPMPMTLSSYQDLMAKGTNTTSPTGKSFDSYNTSIVLHDSIQKRDIKRTLATLQTIKNTSQYNELKPIFEQKNIGNLRKSIPTALFDAFAFYRLPEAKANRILIESEFSRIGLKKVADKWTL